MAKPKIFESGRDMMLSLGVIVIMMIGGVAFTGLCSFNPGTPENGPVPQVDAHSFLTMEAASAGFAVREPALPQGWITNSARRAAVGPATAAVVGVITDQEGYLQLYQTGADVAATVRDIDADFREHARSVDVSGRKVDIYASPNHEADVRDLWVTDLGDARIVVTGAATDEEFSQLLAATIAAKPVRSGA
ncbi:DUF4245 domain-containing protein [Corynebacterium uberis]|uniref:DUF4245 domain-containing protein n=1 Tax=Corynebacterium TaxID=1716 RepID=UPI001D0BE0C8|nr:DUF4245 domain-containing protein [Corynebacterium uberis]MCZ9308894.1 DUF4245 domain-containing protein [Corynebacterium sp. c6VSa_13]UDL74632.1 DUF4245 domain-containing protein [Corynebacterium uberis]UDL76534.1 DUF4245 domain-containing protein [Corynebacterium uberis]UDL78746.1 DUF4245 domain-containing protein [Corynebacterium uberis]UDL81025.1 DUF4245 domain-containing protein [Corynebacterium uberis]